MGKRGKHDVLDGGVTIPEVDGGQVRACDEAGPTGYGLQRALELGGIVLVAVACVLVEFIWAVLILPSSRAVSATRAA